MHPVFDRLINVVNNNKEMRFSCSSYVLSSFFYSLGLNVTRTVKRAKDENSVIYTFYIDGLDQPLDTLITLNDYYDPKEDLSHINAYFGLLTICNNCHKKERTIEFDLNLLSFAHAIRSYYEKEKEDEFDRLCSSCWVDSKVAVRLGKDEEDKDGKKET